MTFARVFGFAALIAFSAVTVTSCSKTKGCKEQKDDKYDAAAEETDATLCNETATVGKFEGNWVGQPGSYSFMVSQTGEADYQFSISTTFGLTGVNAATIKANVTQKTATIANQPMYEGTVAGTITYVNSSSMNVNYTLAGFTTAGINGTYTESLSK